MWRISRRFACVLLFALGVAGNAFAQTTTCTAGSISFNLGNYLDYQATPLDSSVPFTVTCTRNGGPGNTTVTLGLGASATSGTIATRQLRIAGYPDLLAYNFYRDTARTLVWGNTVGTDTISQTIQLGNNASGTLTFTIFGRIGALQSVRPGSYSDSVTATVNF
jgi:spore coat protein U-like protein